LSHYRRRTGIYNVGSGKSISVEDLVKTVMRLSGITKPYMARGTERQNEIFDLYAGIDKIRFSLGWQPETSFEEGLGRCLLPDSFQAHIKALYVWVSAPTEMKSTPLEA